MKPLEMPVLTAEQVDAIATLYRTTHNVRLRTRAQMLLGGQQHHLGVREMAAIVRECAGTVRCWLSAQGIEGLQPRLHLGHLCRRRVRVTLCDLQL